MLNKSWNATLQNITRTTERVIQVGVWINGALLIFLAFLIGFDVLLRKLFNVSVGGADEIGGYILAISSAWAASYTLLKRSHISMDNLYSQLSQRGKYWLDILALLALAAFIGAIAWYGGKVVMKSFDLGSRANTPLLTPLWIPQGLWLLGLAMFLVTITVMLLVTITAMSRHKSKVADREARIVSSEDELIEQMASVQEMPVLRPSRIDERQ